MNCMRMVVFMSKLREKVAASDEDVPGPPLASYSKTSIREANEQLRCMHERLNELESARADAEQELARVRAEKDVEIARLEATNAALLEHVEAVEARLEQKLGEIRACFATIFDNSTESKR